MKKFQVPAPIDRYCDFILPPELALFNLFPRFPHMRQKGWKDGGLCVIFIEASVQKETFMKYPAGCVFSLAEKNAPIPGCTVSDAVCGGETGAVCFSLAEGTDISAEIYFSPGGSLTP